MQRPRNNGTRYVEQLEARTLLAAVFWDGGAGTWSWHDAANWSGDTLPGPADDVTINVAGTTPPITHGQAVGTSVRSLVCNEFFALTAGTLSITSTNWTSSGTMQVDAGTLNLGGALTAATFNPIVRPVGGVGTTVNVTGTFDGAGGVLDIGSAGQFGNGGLSGLTGTLKNVTLVSGDGTSVPGGGNYDGVTLGGNLTFACSAAFRNHVTLANGITVNKGATQWSFQTTGTQQSQGSAETAKNGATTPKASARSGDVGDRLHDSAKGFGVAILDGIKYAGRKVIGFFNDDGKKKE